MARKNIGILLLGRNDWVGGLYYVLNIIKSMYALDDVDQPNLVVFSGNKTAWQEIEQVQYQHLKKVDFHPHLLLKISNRILANITGKDFYTARLCKAFALDAIYPYNYPYKVPANTKVFAWFPDFQHKYLSHLFSKKEIDSRDKFIHEIKTSHLVLSSKDAVGHYNTHYKHLQINIYQLPFVSAVDESILPGQKQLLDKYHIKTNYFIVCNQFWEHKNHWVVFKAIAQLRKKYPDVLLICTGNENDYRNPDYIKNLKQFITEHNLSTNIRFFGFIPRTDQLGLMKNARFIIQPSKFEGWGTVVEDAKSLNKQVVASDIPIHHEQLEDHAYFFNPDDPGALASIMSSALNNGLPDIHHYPSQWERKRQFAKSFVDIMSGEQSFMINREPQKVQ